ncbi:hypothetical protein AB205_0124230 [Aquarana catesbeiana]|uniref:Uncharacterized protein n=1 Tax=Aquarana catesbeiana TaxID=8400 RepID=A0A2G9RXT5_AQUCT|nr:hypothetical protein AB205_0124230 [Aquarana catesbeiana]
MFIKVREYVCMLRYNDHIGLMETKLTFTLDPKGTTRDAKLWVIVAKPFTMECNTAHSASDAA